MPPEQLPVPSEEWMAIRTRPPLKKIKSSKSSTLPQNFFPDHTENIFPMDHSFETYAKFSEKLTFLTPLIRKSTCAYHGVKNARFSEKFVHVLNEWFPRRTALGKVLLQMLCNFIEITLLHGCSPVNLLHIFKTPFYKNNPGGLLLTIILWKCG